MSAVDVNKCGYTWNTAQIYIKKSILHFYCKKKKTKNQIQLIFKKT